MSAFTLDGVRNPTSESGYTERASQLVPSSGGQENALANLYSAATGANLRLFIGSRASSSNAILLFIDSKSGGVPLDGQGRPFIPNNLIQSPEFGWMLNNLGASTTVGMRFEDDFRPDYALRIQGVDDFSATVHRFDLQSGTAHSLGNAVTAVRKGGFVSAIRCNWVNVTDFATAVNGIEMSLNMPLMGLTTGPQTIKVLTMLVSPDSTTASNQCLAPLALSDGFERPPIGTASSFSFESENLTQRISLGVDYTTTDSDGDGLPDNHETNDGLYLSPTATGSDPLDSDSDGDGYGDSQEISGSTSLGFASNPNVPNYVSIWMPGNFTTPAFAAGAGNEMARKGIDLTQQYLWQLDHRISNPVFLGTVRFKFTAGGSPAVNWGPGAGAGSVSLNNNDINASAPATGFYQIDFNQAALSYAFGRKVFSGAAAYLAAYGLSAGTDGDGDGILNENEFVANTDPTRADSDNDGLNDLADPQPLLAVRNIVFSVNMSIQTGIGTFNPALQTVKARFFDGVSGLGELTLIPSGGNGVYTGTLPGVVGGNGTPFDGYKFVIAGPGPTAEIIESLSENRKFNLGTAHVTQLLPEVFFDDNLGEVSPGYEAWAEQFAAHPGEPVLNPDGDSHNNYQEYTFGGNPFAVEGSLVGMVREGGFLIVSWYEINTGVVSYDPLESPDLTPQSWDFPAVSIVPSEDQTGTPEGYTRTEAKIPIEGGKKFIRIRAYEE